VGRAYATCSGRLRRHGPLGPVIPLLIDRVTAQGDSRSVGAVSTADFLPSRTATETQRASSNQTLKVPCTGPRHTGPWPGQPGPSTGTASRPRRSAKPACYFFLGQPPGWTRTGWQQPTARPPGFQPSACPRLAVRLAPAPDPSIFRLRRGPRPKHDRPPRNRLRAPVTARALACHGLRPWKPARCRGPRSDPGFFVWEHP